MIAVVPRLIESADVWPSPQFTVAVNVSYVPGSVIVVESVTSVFSLTDVLAGSVIVGTTLLTVTVVVCVATVAESSSRTVTVTVLGSLAVAVGLSSRYVCL